MGSTKATPLVRRTVNDLLDLIASSDGMLPAESVLAAQLGVSRSPLRKALDLLRRRGVVRAGPRGTVAARSPRPSDRYQIGSSAYSKADAFADAFFAKLASGELRPGQQFSELELAREAGLSTVPIREALINIGAVGLITKEPRRRWAVVRFTSAMVDELYDLRILLELEVLNRAMALKEEDPLREELRTLLSEHEAMRCGQRNLERFLDLDQRFHGTLFRAGGNRFISKEFSAIETLLQFQLQPTAIGIRGMNHGLEQHPPIIGAVLDRDRITGRRLLRDHLHTSRELMKCALREP